VKRVLGDFHKFPVIPCSGLKNRRFWAEIAEIRGDFAKPPVNFPVPGNSG
jgi:hypothetical protein